MRVGCGFDVHAFGPGDFVMLGGVRVPHTHAVVAHSDGDVLLHALCDALLGAAALGDIGQHFKDTDPEVARCRQFGLRHRSARHGARPDLRVVNADLTLIAQAPKLAPHREGMQARIAQLLAVEAGQVNLKATTTEGLGFLGRAEGIAAQAVVLLGPA